MSELTTNCLGIKPELIAFLERHVEVSADEGACVISLPLKTLDGRYIEVHVEATVGDVVLVHDAGHAVAELFLQGIHMSEPRTAVLKAIAKSYNASFSDGTFTAIAKPSTVNNAVLAIAQCASLAMHEVLKHVPVVQDGTMARRSIGHGEEHVRENTRT